MTCKYKPHTQRAKIHAVEVEQIMECIKELCPTKSGVSDSVFYQYDNNEKLYEMYCSNMEDIICKIIHMVDDDMLDNINMHAYNIDIYDNNSNIDTYLDTIIDHFKQCDYTSLPAHLMHNIEIYLHNNHLEHVLIEHISHLLFSYIPMEDKIEVLTHFAKFYNQNDTFIDEETSFCTYIATIICEYTQEEYTYRAYKTIMHIKKQIHMRRVRSPFSQQFDCTLCNKYNTYILSQSRKRKHKTHNSKPNSHIQNSSKPNTDTQKTLTSSDIEKLSRHMELFHYQRDTYRDIKANLREQQILITQDFTKLSTYANVSNHQACREIQDMIIVLEYIDKDKKLIHQYVHMLAESNVNNNHDYYYVQHAWQVLFDQHTFDRFTHLVIFSDNAAKHFKSRYTQHLFCTLAQKYNKHITYNFFAEQHGHSICDTHKAHTNSAIIKHILTQTSYKYRQAHVRKRMKLTEYIELSNVDDIIKYVLNNMNKVQSYNLNSIVRDNSKPNTAPIPNVKQYYSFEYKGDDKVILRKKTNDTNTYTHTFKLSKQSTFTPIKKETNTINNILPPTVDICTADIHHMTDTNTHTDTQDVEII